MTSVEERIGIATYGSVFGEDPSGKIQQDAGIIFDLILIAADDN